ncbi:unnamed protein product, partial [Nesidiocoris tenuis]
MEPSLLSALHRHQFGCVPGRSTEDAIATAVGMVRRSTSRMKMLVFYDIAGAFNSVWWPCVLRRMQALRLPADLYRLVCSYLNGRRAELWFRNGVVTAQVTRGCPQGSVLGAAIWNLVFGELLEVLEDNGFQAVAYVDDLALFVEADTVDALTDVAAGGSRIVVEWARTAHLAVAPSKTQALVFKGPKAVRDGASFEVDGVTVRASLTAKYLGVVMHRNFSIDAHLTMLRSKVCSLTRLMHGVRGAEWGAEFRVVKRHYSSVFMPTVLYAAGNWWSRPSQRIRNVVQQIQRAALVPVCRAYRTTSTAALQVLAGEPPLDLVLDARVAVCSVKSPARTSAVVRSELQAVISENETDAQKIEGIRQWLNGAWQERWDSATTGRLTYQYFPD